MSSPHLARLRIGFLLAMCGCQESPAPENRAPAGRKPTLLQANPEELDLGTVIQLTQRRCSFSLRNKGGQPVRVARISTSCPFLRVPCPDREIAPGETLQLDADLDLREEPAFAGGLRIEVDGYTADRQLAFSVAVAVEVR